MCVGYSEPQLLQSYVGFGPSACKDWGSKLVDYCLWPSQGSADVECLQGWNESGMFAAAVMVSGICASKMATNRRGWHLSAGRNSQGPGELQSQL